MQAVSMTPRIAAEMTTIQNTPLQTTRNMGIVTASWNVELVIGESESNKGQNQPSPMNQDSVIARREDNAKQKTHKGKR